LFRAGVKPTKSQVPAWKKPRLRLFFPPYSEYYTVRWNFKASQGFHMPQAIVDPGELRRFIQHLKKFNGEVLEQMQSTQRQLVGLGATWRDQEHERFLEEFEQQLRTLSRFVDITNQYVPYLLRKAERIEEYLQQR
jgi:uncharacterized protein YukE